MDQKEINKILIKNRRMIELLADKVYKKRQVVYVDRDDYKQEAFYLASKLLTKYNSKKGSLSTYLYANLPKMLLRFGYDNVSCIHLPVHIFESMRKVRKYCRQNNISTDDLTDQIVKDVIGEKSRSIDIVKRMVTEGSLSKNIDFDKVLETDNYYESYNDIDNYLDQEIRNRLLRNAILKEEQVYIDLVTDYYQNNLVLKDLAKKHNTSISAVNVRLVRTRKRLYKRLKNLKEVLLYD